MLEFLYYYIQILQYYNIKILLSVWFVLKLKKTCYNSRMRVPQRKPGKFTHLKPDPLMTERKLSDIKKELARLKEIQPRLAAEVARLAELGDFSENAEYQLAKGKLRGINDAILRLNYQIDHAEIIKPNKNTNIVQVGNTVTVEVNNKTKTYLILGSAETAPSKGIISHNSPLGVALMGRIVGDTIEVIIGRQKKEYKILEIK